MNARLASLFAASLVALSAAACDDEPVVAEPDGGLHDGGADAGTLDAGPALDLDGGTDASMAAEDAGEELDAAVPEDAGETLDAAVEEDAGGELDASVSPKDAGLAIDAGGCAPGADCIPSAWIGMAFTASGTCSGSSVHYSACASGCCSSTERFGAVDSTIDFEFLADPGGTVMHVSSVQVGGSIQPKDVTSPASTTGMFVVDPFALRVTISPVTGRLTTSRGPTSFGLRIAAHGTGPSSGMCPVTEVSRSCSWSMPD